MLADLVSGEPELSAHRGDFRIWREAIAANAFRMRCEGESGRLSARDVIALWQNDTAFCAAFAESLRSSPFDAFFWEAAPISARSLELPFEYVLIESRSLAGVRADPNAFADQFRRVNEGSGVCVFPNLGGDALLVAPCPAGSTAIYAHLAAFVRGADEKQITALFGAVGRAAEDRLRRDDSPCWISTSGLGVYWVHVRLDTSPKYYVHPPYRQPPDPTAS